LAGERRDTSNTSGEGTAAYVAAVLAMVGDADPFELLREGPARFETAVSGRDEAALVRPEGPGRWSARDVVAHMADSELVWAWRIRLVLGHDGPGLTGYDQDAFAARLHYHEQPLSRSQRRFDLLRGDNLWLLERASPAERARVGVHSERGEESLDHMIRLYAGHDLVHLAQLERILAGSGSA
jgi:uncharacterized damage-inducible protein DinB